MWKTKILELFTKREIGAGEIQKILYGGDNFDIRDAIWELIRDGVLELTPSFKLKLVEKCPKNDKWKNPEDFYRELP